MTGLDVQIAQAAWNRRTPQSRERIAEYPVDLINTSRARGVRRGHLAGS
jgi:hypothetical protein